MTPNQLDIVTRLRARRSHQISNERAALCIEELAAELAASAEREEKLHAALRDQVITGPWDLNEDNDAPFVSSRCLNCDGEWEPGTPERHVPGCLAAPKEGV